MPNASSLGAQKLHPTASTSTLPAGTVNQVQPRIAPRDRAQFAVRAAGRRPTVPPTRPSAPALGHTHGASTAWLPLVIDAARRAVRRLRGLRDHLLHRPRRGRILARQSAAGRPPRVLILCHGNICRSPYAKARLIRLLEERGWRDTLVESAGFIGPGRPANELAQRVASARGIDLSHHHSQTLTSALAASPTLVIVMTREQSRAAKREAAISTTRLVILGDVDPQAISERDIPDPYGKSAEVFGLVFDRIDRCLRALTHAWDSSTSTGDVSPPASGGGPGQS